MTTAEAIEIRDRAIDLGLKDCCETCAEAIERLDKLGLRSGFTLASTQAGTSVVGLGQEEAARYLRRQIGAKA